MKNKTKTKKTTTKNITSTQDLYIVKISKSFFFVSYTFLTFLDQPQNNVLEGIIKFLWRTCHQLRMMTAAENHFRLRTRSTDCLQCSPWQSTMLTWMRRTLPLPWRKILSRIGPCLERRSSKAMIFSDDLEPHPPRYLIRRIELSLQAPLTECIRPLSSLFDPKDECDRKKTLFFFCGWFS